MKLLKEDIQDVLTEVLEEGEGKKGYYLSGTFMQTETVNKNGRMYPRSIMEKELNRYNSFISAKRALGELGHPDTPTVNLERASHLITDLHFENNNVIGKAKVLDTPFGKIVKNFIDEGVILGMSSRALGSLKTVNGINIVQEDLKLATVDIVHEPSAPDAFVQSIMEEREWMLIDGVWTPKQLRESKEKILQASSAEIEKVALQIFETFLKTIKL